MGERRKEKVRRECAEEKGWEARRKGERERE